MITLPENQQNIVLFVESVWCVVLSNSGSAVTLHHFALQAQCCRDTLFIKETDLATGSGSEVKIVAGQTEEVLLPQSRVKR